MCFPFCSFSHNYIDKLSTIVCHMPLEGKQRSLAQKLAQDKIKLLQTVEVPQAQKHADTALKLLDTSLQECAQVEEKLSDILSFFDLKFVHVIKKLWLGLANKSEKMRKNYCQCLWKAA